MRRAIGAWLRRPAIEDPVDRRNAPMLQVVLILLGTLSPLAWAWRILGTDIPWRPNETTSLLSSLLVAIVAWISFALVRRGRFQWAIRQLLAIVALQVTWNYSSNGLSAHTYEQPLLVMWLFVAGVAVGRRALWAMYAAIVVALFAGAWVEGRSGSAVAAHLLGDAAIRAAMILLIAVVIDRTTKALRDSLAAAMRQGERLAAANAQLTDEIAERERMQAQLLHAQKVETIGHLAAGVAHDFNHLLALIQGYVDRAKGSVEADETQAALSGIGMAAQRAAGITHRLLDFSRYDAARPERFDAREALEELAPLLRQALGSRVALDMHLPSFGCPVVFDRAQFGLAVLNLATNSAHAIDGEGRFVIELARSRDGPLIEIRARDDGAGIDPELQARVLDPFFTTKPPGQGTGLGLPMVKGLVESFGGSLALESTPGDGTCITISLPLAAEGGNGEGRYQASM